MKVRLLAILAFCISQTVFSQTNYRTSYSWNSGNPGGLNSDTTDLVTANWNPLLRAAIAVNQWSPDLAIPFPFEFYGQPVTSLKASGNGLISFAVNPSLPDNNTNLPSAILPDSTIACFWDAFTNAPPTGNNDSVIWRVFGTSPNRQLWIKWVSYEVGAPMAGNATFSCVLEETTNNIYMVESDFLMLLSTPWGSVTTGLQLNGTTANQYDNQYRQRVSNAATPADNNYITFAPYTTGNMSVVSVDCSHPASDRIPKNSKNNPIVRVKVSTSGELNPLTVSEFALSTNGTIVNSDVTQAKIFFTGNDSLFNANTQFGATINNPAFSFTAPGTQSLVSGDNYFWIVFDIATMPSFNPIDGECYSVTISGSPVLTGNPTPPGSFTVTNGLSGIVTVGASGTYHLLSEAFKAVNEEGLSNDLDMVIMSDIADTGSAVLTYANQSNFHIRIKPSDNVLKNISARIAGTYIDLSGTNNVTIDGNDPVAATGKYLRFINLSDTGATIRFRNGTHTSTVKNAIIEGASRYQNTGLVHFSGTQTLLPNHHITIRNNDIRDRSDSLAIPAILVYSKGSVHAKNHHISILENNLFNYMRSGVYIDQTGNDGFWKVNGNSFYYNAASEPAAGDHVSIMMIPGAMADSNEISGNYIGGTSAQCGGSAWVNSRAVNFVAMNISSGMANGTSIQNNTIQNIHMTSPVNAALIGIRLEAGRAEVGTITGNLIGHLTTANSITNNLYLTFAIYGFVQGNAEVIVANNTIANINATNTTNLTGMRGISFQGGAASPYIVNNTIRNLTSANMIGSATTPALAGITISSGTNLGTIYIGKNTVHDLTNTPPGTNNTPSGILVDHLSANGIIEANTVYNIFSTCATGNIHGIYLQGPTKDWIVRNNMISLTNGSNTGALIIRGISDAFSANSNTQYLNNSVYIGGTASGTVNSFAFERRTANSTPKLVNNILYNERTGGTGLHTAIGNIAAATNWTPLTSGYNLLVAASPNAIGAWGATPAAQSFAQWQTVSGGDYTSWSDTAANIPATSFFKNAAAGDLSIDTSTALSWYADGKGMPLTSVTADKQGHGRNSSVPSGPIDIGADEFVTNTLPPLARVSGQIVTGDSTVFTFAGRNIATVYWKSGSLPSQLDCRFYSGRHPMRILSQGGALFACYTELTPTGGSAYAMDVKQYYDSAQFGQVSNSSNILSTSASSAYWSVHATTLNQQERSFRCNNLNEFGNFSGTDVTNPVPVKLLAFSGRNRNGSAHLQWSTASEKNSERFEIEAGTSATQFERAGSVQARGNSTFTTAYSFTDEAAFEKRGASKLFYRLKMIDKNGSFTYSNIVALAQNERSGTDAAIYPNPFTADTKVAITSAGETRAAVSITNLQGILIGTETVELQDGINTFLPAALASAEPGIYLVTVTVNGESQVLKLVK